ncbi:alpha/beta fold hydrolase [Ciceribacter sp. L1K23]|uniref:alpha/beta hydrolase n=1 Tax=Ciceribacter sp. L1K23 TaxID=2820276 RepID=UPI001B8300AC|nr:alpha/beta hydrolase [Ciceribacter sp. L1K23]MBR0554838.1 alpha/beta fold hydrolase [Ciceribacter sp. L1K23]
MSTVKTNSAARIEAPVTQWAEIPIAFAGMVGHFGPGGGPVGIVICDPWGFDQLCTRKFHRVLAASMASRGYPTLRFDYPGEGDAPAVKGGADLESWIEGAVSAGHELRRLSGCGSVIFYGLGLGGAIALAAAERFNATSGVVLAVPALNGRRFLRETGLRERVIVEDLGITLDYPEGSVSLAGFILPTGVAAELKSFGVEGRGLKAGTPLLFLKRPENATDEQVLQGLREAGHAVDVATFPGYGEMMNGLNVSVTPPEPIAAVVEWIAARWPLPDSVGRQATQDLPAPSIEDGSYIETPLLIGAEPRLFGVLCEPRDLEPRATVVFVNMAYTYHIGWGGLWVDAARTLAADGIRSLRIDLSNIGDSPARPGTPEQVVYASAQQHDLREAVDALQREYDGPVYLVGTCSGAYAALSFAGANSDIAGVVSVNQLRLIWDEDEDVEETLRAGARPLADYQRRAFSLGTYRRLLDGDIDVRRAIGNLLRLVAGRLVRGLAPYLGRLTKLGRFRTTLFGMLRDMKARGARVTFVGCRIDGSLDELARYFGGDFAGLKSFDNIDLQIIEETDHMLTPLSARRQLIDIIRSVARADRSARDFTQT